MFSAANFALIILGLSGTFCGPGTRLKPWFFWSDVGRVAKVLKRLQEKFLWLKWPSVDLYSLIAFLFSLEQEIHVAVRQSKTVMKPVQNLMLSFTRKSKKS